MTQTGAVQISSDRELTAALQRIDRLWDAEIGSPDGDELEQLVSAVERYEARYDLPKATPT
jgi:HTH-type transcriptional regulator/antitoxin HigA